MCCTASALVLACHTCRQRNTRLAAPVPANLPSLLKLVQWCQWCGHAQQGSPGRVQPHATFTSSWEAALPQPLGICRVISILCNKQRAACLLRKSSMLCFPQTATQGSDYLQFQVTLMERLCSTPMKARTHHSEPCLIPPWWLVSPLILIKLPPHPCMNLNTGLQSPFETAFLHLKTQQAIRYPSQLPSQASPACLFTSW